MGAGVEEYSLLLALSLHNNKNGTDWNSDVWNSEFNKQVLKLMEIILFRIEFAVIQARSNYFNRAAYNFHLDDVFNKCYYAEKGKKEEFLINSLIDYAFKGFKWYWKTETHFIKFFDYRNNKLNNFYGEEPKATKYLLWKYENYLRKIETHVSVKTNLIATKEYHETKENGGNFTSIEHVYPQNPKEGVANLGEVIHDIGNLVAMNLSLNIGLSNKDPDKKYGDMNPADFRHHNKIINDVKHKTWNKDTIIENGKKIKDFALKYFSIYKPVLDAENKVQFIEEGDNLSIVVDNTKFNLDFY